MRKSRKQIHVDAYLAKKNEETGEIDVKVPMIALDHDKPEDTKYMALSMEEAEALAEEVMDIWLKARVVAGVALDTFAPAINALMPVITYSPELATMAVDMYYRCYITPAYVKHQVENARSVSATKPCALCGATSHHELAYVAGDIYHEVQHCLRKHGQRARAIIHEKDLKQMHRKWNIAADMEIDDDAIELFGEAYTWFKQNNHGGQVPRLCYGKTAAVPHLMPNEIGLEMNNLTEYYYRNLPENPHQQQSKNGEGDQKPEKGDGKGRTCGSGATGMKADYEQDAPSEDQPGIDEVDASDIAKAVAKNIQQHAKQRGSGALGNMLDWANEILPPSVYDWKKEFNRVIKSNVSRVFGHRHRNFNKPNKRSGATDYKVIYPSRFTRLPKIHIVLDTSGSMWSRGQNAMAEIEQICKSSRAHVDISCVDWDVYKKQKVRSVKDLKLQGGGGTSMKRGIEQIMENPKAKDLLDIMILVTDGETDYPSKATMRGIPLIIAVVNERDDVMKDVPSCFDAVYIPVGDKK